MLTPATICADARYAQAGSRQVDVVAVEDFHAMSRRSVVRTASTLTPITHAAISGSAV